MTALRPPTPGPIRNPSGRHCLTIVALWPIYLAAQWARRIGGGR